MPSKNNVIQSVHLRKHWCASAAHPGHVRTWFNQPARKLRRRNARLTKARQLFPRPVDGSFRSVVHCPTQRYNMKVREGRGFSLAELKKAKINEVEAKRLAISIDHRRRTERLENINRLKQYRARIIINPKQEEAIQLTVPVVKITGTSKRTRATNKPPRHPKPLHPRKVFEKKEEKK
ncbi:putative 60S ribosomal protein L13-3 [Blattamonas nauphoetae]|uniref:60S ribosomal protein L13-3 n=1 Tax=Blattamonas nauphoetae TaxID=2049346 RepID=A0ABQ9YKR7_9EUKA|nr:putative 60S ribosomal protein L13-3 [Blattamonas nauphoetae]KAK2964351.1 putative 60S ribosomal protein L13-3 [Blattamonas nauphoetae]